MHTTSPSGAPRRGLLAVMAAAVAWGTGGLAAQHLQARGGLGVEATACCRLLVGAPLLALAAPTARPRRLRSARPTGRRASVRARVVVVGAGIGIYQLCYFASIDRIGLAAATVITIGLTPVAVAVGRVVVAGAAPTARTVASIVVAGVGLWLLVGPGAAGSPGSGDDAGTAGGVGFAVGSAVGYGVVVLVRQSLPPALDASSLTAVALGIGAAVLLPLGVVDGLGMAIEPATLALVLYLGAIPTALAYALFFRGLEHTNATHAALATMLEPLTATSLAVSVGDESLRAPGVVGAGLLIGALAVPLLPSRGAGRASAVG